MLKNWSGSGPDGIVHVIDLDTIEKSNLNRSDCVEPLRRGLEGHKGGAFVFVRGGVELLRMEFRSWRGDGRRRTSDGGPNVHIFQMFFENKNLYTFLMFWHAICKTFSL